jgi:hypothetical protein
MDLKILKWETKEKEEPVLAEPTDIVRREAYIA